MTRLNRRTFVAGVAAGLAAASTRGVLARAAKTVKETTGEEPALVGDFRRLLDDRRVEAVVVATPHHWHCPIAVRALGAGKDVYVEKPASCWPRGSSAK